MRFMEVSIYTVSFVKYLSIETFLLLISTPLQFFVTKKGKNHHGAIVYLEAFYY